MKIGRILNIKRFEMHDGDGVRTTLFLKGCPLRCKWCHNPESLAANPEIGYLSDKCTACGRCAEVCPYGAHSVRDGVHTFNRELCHACGKCEGECAAGALKLYGKRDTAEELLPLLLEDKAFYDNSGGGVTISGGEPLLQAEFCAELLCLLKKNGINTALDTTLFAPRESLKLVMPYVDTFLVDVKAAESELHRRLCGVPNEKILENLRYLDSERRRIEIRIPYIPRQNSGEIEKIAQILAPLKCIAGVRVLPYHRLSGTKYASVGREYPLSDEDAPLPTNEEIAAAELILENHGIRVLKS